MNREFNSGHPTLHAKQVEHHGRKSIGCQQQAHGVYGATIFESKPTARTSNSVWFITRKAGVVGVQTHVESRRQAHRNGRIHSAWHALFKRRQFDIGPRVRLRALICINVTEGSDAAHKIFAIAHQTACHRCQATPRLHHFCMRARRTSWCWRQEMHRYRHGMRTAALCAHCVCH